MLISISLPVTVINSMFGLDKFNFTSLEDPKNNKLETVSVETDISAFPSIKKYNL